MSALRPAVQDLFYTSMTLTTSKGKVSPHHHVSQGQLEPRCHNVHPTVVQLPAAE
jgi:hypothetical protein